MSQSNLPAEKIAEWNSEIELFLRESRDRWKDLATRLLIVVLIESACLIMFAISNMRHS